MSTFKESSRSLLQESLRILDEDSGKPSDNHPRFKNGKKCNSARRDLLRSSSVKEIEKVKKQLKQKQNLVNENIRKLKLLNQSLKEKTAKRILENVGYKPDADLRSKKSKPEDEKTVFTEEDFAKFEREYFAC